MTNCRCPVLQRGLGDPTILGRSVVPTFGDTAHRRSDGIVEKGGKAVDPFLLVFGNVLIAFWPMPDI